jgi:hypothetical protein
MTALSIQNGSREHNGRKGAKLVLKLWVRAGVVTAATVVFGVLYFFFRQYFKDGVWRFDLSLVNKSLGTAALFLVALSMFLTGKAYFSRRSGSSLAYRKHYGLMGFWTGLVHGAVNHFWLPAVGLYPERKLDAWLSDAPGLAALVLLGAMALLSNAGAKARLGGGAWRRILRYGGYTALMLAMAHAALLKWASWAKYLRTFDSVLPSLSLPVATFAAAAVLLRLAMWVSDVWKK